MYKILKLNVLFVSFILAWGTLESLAQDLSMGDLNPRMRPKMEIDQERVQANGIRKVQGKHLDLYTDLRGRPEIDELVVVFDLAIEEWCDYFNIDTQNTKPYRLSGFVIEDQTRFKKAGLMPDDLPDFLAGFNRGHEIWVFLQPGQYYTRHLLLHEGTHAFMQWFLQGSGPHWYSEGMAEKLALHQWKNGSLKLNFRATDRSQVEYWGRPKLIREARNTATLKTIDDVFEIPAFEYRQVESYAWSWALCEFLSEHPLTHEHFKQLVHKCSDSSNRFTVDFLQKMEPNRPTIDRDWRLFLSEHDYGIEAKRMTIWDAESKPGKNDFLIHADKGWQRTHVNIKKGDPLNIMARGRFQIADIDQPWQSEAGGVTIEYYRGSPLGMLLVGVVNENDVDGLLKPIEVGLETKIIAPMDGQLCFRINDSPSKMNDNSGYLEVSVEKTE